MKKTIFCFLVFAAICESAFTQLLNLGKDGNLSLYAFKDDPETYQGYPNAPAKIDLWYVDKNDVNLYGEGHEITLDRFSGAHIWVGKGIPDPDNQYSFDQLDFTQITKLSFNLTVTTPDGEKEVSGEHKIGTVPWSVISDNSYALGNNKWDGSLSSLDEMLDAPQDKQYCLPLLQPADITLSYDKVIKVARFSDLLSRKVAKSIVTKDELPYTCVGTGTNRPVAFGLGPLVDLVNYFTFCSGPLDRLWHAMAVKVPAFEKSESAHGTAALYLEHNLTPGGTGLISSALERGILTQGRDGVTAFTNTADIGFAVSGIVATAPGPSRVKVGLLGNNGGFANSSSIGLNGDGYIFGNLVTMSDATLKTEIRSHLNALEMVNKLRPSQYQYIHSDVYHLPDEVQHGFIAQEMEEVFPELVKEITIPKTFDYDKISTAETETYKAINYEGMISILTAALQELNSKVDAQAAEIDLLKKESKSAKGRK